jgi:hypothetical protein
MKLMKIGPTTKPLPFLVKRGNAKSGPGGTLLPMDKGLDVGYSLAP